MRASVESEIKTSRIETQKTNLALSPVPVITRGNK